MNSKHKKDFRKRTKQLASSVIQLYCAPPKTQPEVQILGKQLLRSGTSVAANDREASKTRSAAEFVSKVETCAQETDKTQLWLDLLRDDCDIHLVTVNV